MAAEARLLMVMSTLGDVDGELHAARTRIMQEDARVEEAARRVAVLQSANADAQSHATWLDPAPLFARVFACCGFA